MQVGPSTVRYQVFCICPFCCFCNFLVFMNRKGKKEKKEDVCDQVDIIGKVFRLGEAKTSNAGNCYVDCTIMDTTKRERSLNFLVN